MRRARRGGPGGRSHPWLNLCRNNSELRKLLPVYFSNIAHNHILMPSECSENCTSDIKLSKVCSSSQNQQGALKEIGNSSAASKVRKDRPGAHSSLFHIDEDATAKLHQLINFSLISKSLNLSPIHWKSVPQLYGIKDKHNSAICGVVIKKKRNKKSSRVPASENASLDKCKTKKKLAKLEEATIMPQLVGTRRSTSKQSTGVRNLESKNENHQLPTVIEDNNSQDLVSSSVGKRQRRLTVKAAEAIAQATLKKQRRSSSGNSFNKVKILSDDEQPGSENEKTMDASKTTTREIVATIVVPNKQIDLTVTSPYTHSLLPSVEKADLKTETDSMNVPNLNGSSLISTTIGGQPFTSESSSNEALILSDSLPHINTDSPKTLQNESFSEITTVEATTEDQLDVVVTSSSYENKSLSDAHKSENENESLGILDNLINETLTVSERSPVRQQGICVTKSPHIGPLSNSLVTQENEVSNNVPDELTNEITSFQSETSIQTDLIANNQLNLPKEKESGVLCKENTGLENKANKQFDEASLSVYNNQEQFKMSDEIGRNMGSNSLNDSSDTPPMKSDVQNRTVTKPAKSKAHKRSPSPTDVPIIRSKRRLKVNHRFLDDYDGYLGFISGGRRSRASSEVSNGSEGSNGRNNEHPSRHTTSWYERKNANEKIKRNSHGNLIETSTKLSSKEHKSNDNENGKHGDKNGNRPVTGLRPRVKQVSRPSLNRENSRYSSTLSAMVHAARLAAVGAKVPGGVSPVHAALAASAAHSNKMKEKHFASKQDNAHITGHTAALQNLSHSSRPTSTSQHSTHLPNRCGQCPACLGLIQPCGRCNDCRLVDSNDPRGQPCRELICFRRRAAAAAADQNMKAGPRVKFPSNYPSPGSTSNLPISGYKGALSSPNIANHYANSRSTLNNKSDDTEPESVSLLRTIPGLAQQLELDAWLPSSNSRKIHSSGVNNSYRRKQRNPANSLNVGPEIQVTPVRGGDLGMHFNPIIEENDENEDLDRVRPVEGEVIDNELASQGGYAIVTTLAAAPPKEICYACGSGGGQLLFCVSCAEPFHFYCVERQFRPRRKEHFVCRNCTTCKVCRRPASDLRCIRCSTGYHPDCLLDFPPAKTSQRGCWTCPECSVCLHCGVRACKPAETNDGMTPTSTVRGNYTAWSYEANKCAACSQAESKGDVCPECDRAYLPTTKQMVQCDSCQLWMHRTCTKLTVDEYELIARMPAGQLSKYVVTCSVCQKEQKSQQNKSNTSRNNNSSSKRQLDIIDQTGSDDESEYSDENNDEVLSLSKHPLNTSTANNNSSNNGASQLRILAQDTLMERMAGLIQTCRKSNQMDQTTTASSMNSPSSSFFFHSPTNTVASSSGKSPGYWSNNNANYYKDESTVRQYLPQYDGVCDSDSGDELTAAVEAAASLWDPTVVEHGKFNSVPDNFLSISSKSTNDLVHHPDKLPCETVYNTYNDASDISLVPVNMPHATSQPLETDTSCISINVNSIRNTCNSVSSNEMPIARNQYSSPLTIHTSLLKTEPSVIQSSVLQDSALRECNLNHNRRRYSSSSSSNSRYHQICSTPPPMNAQWLVENESEQILTSPRSFLYRLLTRILHRLSAHPVSSPVAVVLRRLLRWLSTMTETLFPWLNINEMASDVRDILRQSDGKFSDVVKHFHERSLIELHELICPVIARLNENCSRIRNPTSGQSVNSVTSVSTCFQHAYDHLKEYHPKYQLSKPPEMNPLEFAKQFLLICKRSRCQRPHEMEMLEQMKQSARDDRWIEHWSSIEEELVVKKFQDHLIKLYRKRLHELPVSSSSQQVEGDLNSNGCKAIASPVRNFSENVNDMPKSNSNSELGQLDSTVAVDNNIELSNQEIRNELDTNPENKELNPQDFEFPAESSLLIKEGYAGRVDRLSAQSATIDYGRFYFALDKFWTEDELKKPIVLPGHIPSFRLVDLDEEEELNRRATDDALRKQLHDDLEGEDSRRCLLCGYHGDDNIEGRLLYTGSDTWVHVNCALWCNDVYEEDSGELIGLSDAIRRGRSSKCADCGKYGATLYCSNMNTQVCPLAVLVSSNSCDFNCVGAVHFSCALRRCPPLPRCIFTADRSWFCSPICHHTVMNQRLAEALRSLKKSFKGNSDKKSSYAESWNQSSDEEFLIDSFNPSDFVDHPSFASTEEAIADDLEPIGLGDLLVCRRVFVPSDCFAASVYPQSISGNILSHNLLMSDNEHSELMRAAKEAVSALAVSPNSIYFLQNNGLSANNLVITIGSLRVDRLGEVREASDSLAMAKWIPGAFEERNTVTRSNYLCPINYRARRIYWSWSKLDSRIPYTLQVKQNQTVHASSGYIETPISRPSPNMNVNTNKSALLSKLPVVNFGSLTADHKNSRLVNVDSRIRLLTPLSNRSASYVFTSNNTTSTTHNFTNSSIGNNVKDISNTISTVQDASKTLTAILTNTPSIVSSQTALITGYEPTLLMSHPTGGHLVNISPYSTIPVSSFQLVPSTINTPMNQGQIIQSSTLAGQNSSLKILNAVSLCTPKKSQLNQQILQQRQTTQQQVVSVQITPQTPVKLNANLATFDSVNNIIGFNSDLANISQFSRTSGCNVISAKQHLLQPQQTCRVQLQTVQQLQKSHLNPYNGKTVILPDQCQSNVNNISSHLSVSSPTIFPVHQHNGIGISVPRPICTVNPIASNTNKALSVHNNRPTTVIRIQNVHPNPKTGILTTPTKDTQLATQLDGLFQNIATVGSQNRRGEATTPGHLLPQFDGTGDDDNDPDYRFGHVRKCLNRTRSSSSLTSSDSSSRSYIRTAASGRNQSLFPNNCSRKNELLCRANKNSRAVGAPSSKPSGKRRWVEDRIKQQELAHLVSKAKQANHARLYQNEVEKHARSFRLTFSVDGIVRSANSPMAAWRAVIMRVSALREKQGLKPLICTAIDGWTQFGLNHRYTIFLIEQMRGALHCYRYKFRYHWQMIDRLRQKFTPPVPCSEGCARAVPWTKPRRPRNHAHDPLSFLHCKANPPPRPLISSGDDNSILPYQDACLTNTNEPAKLLSPNEQATCREAARQAALLVATQLKLPQRLRKSCIAKAVVQATGIPLQSTPTKSANDNELMNSTDQVFGVNYSDDDDSCSVSSKHEEGEDNEDDEADEDDIGTIATQFSRLLSGPSARFYRVSVHPSRIHGRGLFALREFREDEMVIEYTGELIRSIICDARELKYRATGVDCYMFRIDPDWVIDATYAGNAARFINHACDPNCYAKVLSIDDKKHIVILAQRKIYPGEELTYDYRFPKESDKLLCNCGSYTCRKYLN